jgi:hypothetical protein
LQAMTERSCMLSWFLRVIRDGERSSESAQRISGHCWSKTDESSRRWV